MKHLFCKAILCLGLIFWGCVPHLRCFARTASPAKEYLRILFYNTENFFDCQDDSLTRDEAFLPEGDYHWTPARFRHKTHQIAKVLAIAGDTRYPDLFALAEVETEDNLKYLLKTAGMEQYRYIYGVSEDARGIDVCLAYHRYRFKPLTQDVIHLRFPQDNLRRTRPILYACMLTQRSDSLHLFVCHWPSKYGGARQSSALRAHAATVLRSRVDSIFRLQPRAKILIMGDFNDQAQDASLREYLGALPDTCRQISDTALYNLMWTSTLNDDIKSHRYQGEWSMLDQMVVSGALFRQKLKAQVFKPDFLLVEDEKHLGKKPLRSYYGYQYLGGYSDHLPVFVDIPLRP